VAVSIGAAYALDALGLRTLARLALAPVYPALLAVLGIAGGFHSASGESRWMVLTAVVAVILWSIVIAAGRRLSARRRGSA
jgi:hypothetical protein